MKRKEITEMEKLEEEITVEWKKASIIVLGRLCLKDLGSRVNHITIRPLCESMLKYMSNNNYWDSSDSTLFPVLAFKSVSFALSAQLSNTIIRFLLVRSLSLSLSLPFPFLSLPFLLPSTFPLALLNFPIPSFASYLFVPFPSSFPSLPLFPFPSLLPSPFPLSLFPFSSPFHSFFPHPPPFCLPL